MVKFESELRMADKTIDLARRSWRHLRVGLLWAQKGREFNRRFITELRRSVKSLSGGKRRARIHYGERQLSFGKSPVIQVKMHRPASMRFLFPCLNSEPDFDSGFSDSECGCFSGSDNGEDEIDLRAQKFIDEFYEQMKLQRAAIKQYIE